MALLSRKSEETLATAPVAIVMAPKNEAVLLALWRDLDLGSFKQVRGMLDLPVKVTPVSSLARTITTTAAKFLGAGFDMASLNPLNVED